MHSIFIAFTVAVLLLSPDASAQIWPQTSPLLHRNQLDSSARSSNAIAISFSYRRSSLPGRINHGGGMLLTLRPGAAATKAKAAPFTHKQKDSADTPVAPQPAATAHRASPRSSGNLPQLRPRDARDAVAAAKKAAGSRREMKRFDSLAKRARLSALLPSLRLRATRLIDESSSLAPTAYDPQRTTARGGSSLWLEARSTWSLDRLVFASEEVRIEKLRADRARVARKLARRVMRLLFRWQRAAVELRDPLLGYHACWRLWLREQQLVAALDIATAGWMSRWRRRRGYMAAVRCDERPLDLSHSRPRQAVVASADRSIFPFSVRGKSSITTMPSGVM